MTTDVAHQKLVHEHLHTGGFFFTNLNINALLSMEQHIQLCKDQ